MTRFRVLGFTPGEDKVRSRKIHVMFVCSGARDVTVDHAVYPQTGECTTSVACPARDICFWYAAHDLGGGDSYLDYAPASQLEPAFRKMPFFCPNFTEMRIYSDHRRKKKRRKRDTRREDSTVVVPFVPAGSSTGDKGVAGGAKDV